MKDNFISKINNLATETSSFKSFKSILIALGFLYFNLYIGLTFAAESTTTTNSNITTQSIPADADERILSFKSFIKVEDHGSLRVTETIIVNSNQKQIVHGLYRDFPTVYHNNSKLNIPFRVMSLMRDGNTEPYHLSSLKNGVRIYFGDIHTNLSSGQHEYVLKYYTNHQLGYFENFDELYWNVTGNDWAFPIDSVTAEIELPKGAKITQSAAYTGFQEEKGANFKSYTNEQGNIVFVTTKKLAPKEGLTVSVAWPKGFINKYASFFSTKDPRDRENVYLAFGFLIVLSIYSYLIRRRVRKFTHSGVIIPLYEPPPSISPSAANYLYFKGDRTQLKKNGLTSALLDLGVKGYLKIKESSKKFSLIKTSSFLPSSASNKIAQNYPEEEVLANGLFSKGDSINFGHIASGSSIAEQIRTTYEQYVDTLHNLCSGYLQKNYKSVIFGFIVAYIGFKIISSHSAITNIALYSVLLFVILSILFFRQYIILVLVGAFLFLIFSYSGRGTININDIGIQDLPLFDFNIITTIILGALLLLVTLSNVSIFKTYTPTGRKLADEIEGFKLFLSVTEAERYKMLQAPEVTTAIFEKYLPFAVALGVEKAWAKALSKEFTPVWYEGDRKDKFSNATTFPSNITAFSSALTLATLNAIAASKSTSSGSSPGSSSGSSGGGSSGGGGGGGGGGGW